MLWRHLLLLSRAHQLLYSWLLAAVTTAVAFGAPTSLDLRHLRSVHVI